jgi:phenylpropionate dioxygenase-like ring-hydroxylating dioxygenase large terminal subunit
MATKTYDVIDVEKGHLDRSIFVDEQIYQEELEKIFGRAWLCLSHESLIRNPNDFFLTYMGEDPVILTRDAQGELHAFLNMCRHRGNRIVRADDGNAKNFMCAYHGWTYSNQGKLVSVPGLQEAYYGELDVDNLGLVEVAQLDTYAGYVFATWDPEAPTLEAYLGDIRWYWDNRFNHLDGGLELIGPAKWIIPNNWKNSADNFTGDSYHAAISHRSATIAAALRRGQEPRPLSYKSPGSSEVTANGHGISATLIDADQVGKRRNDDFLDPAVAEYQQSIGEEMERRLGFLRGRRMSTAHTNIFPNLSSTGRTVRIWHPRGPLSTETWCFSSIDHDAPPEIKKLQRLTSFGPSGTFEQDDMDNWRNATEAGLSAQARKYPQLVSMGVGHEVSNPELPGRSAPNRYAEINQRFMYLRWQEMMNADSWADISIDPITAEFEGTATMKE